MWFFTESTGNEGRNHWANSSNHTGSTNSNISNDSWEKLATIKIDSWEWNAPIKNYSNKFVLCVNACFTHMPIIPIVANVTIVSCSLGSMNAIANNAKPLIQFDKIKVFFLPQYFNRNMHTIVPRRIRFVNEILLA